MICILRMNGTEITGWIIGIDTQDARRKAHAAGIMDLAEQLYRMEVAPRGRTELPGGYVMLTD